jgi:tetratricopeptide (TPR) repeat protein
VVSIIKGLTSSLVAGLASVTQPVEARANPGAVVAPSRTLHLTTAEMFNLAEHATGKGDLKTVSAIYAALEHNPNPDVRAEARFRQAKYFMQQNRNREAAVLLRRVLDDKPDATGVRLQLAQLLQGLGDSEAALREIRAAQASGLPPAVARIVDRYSEALRAARPIGASVEFAIAPDSNINHATRSDTLGTIFGDFNIAEDSKAKSGIGLSVRGQAYRRFAIGSADHAVLLRASGSGDLYGKSSFNDIAADVAAGPELMLGRNRVNIELGVTQRWFGQKPFTQSARIAATWTRPLGPQMQFRLTGSAALIDNRLNDLQDGKAYSGQVGLERALSSTTGIAMTLGLDRQSLKDAGYSTTGWRAGLVGWKDVGRATLTISADIGRLKADERLALFPKERSEYYSRLRAGATFRQLTFLGFAPVARFTIERNRSSIEFYDYQRTRSELGIVRAF